jgi:hypothetical protein
MKRHPGSAAGGGGVLLGKPCAVPSPAQGANHTPDVFLDHDFSTASAKIKTSPLAGSRLVLQDQFSVKREAKG